MEKYSWVNFLKELSIQILNFKKDHSGLLGKLKEVKIIKDKFDAEKYKNWKNIEPFSFISILLSHSSIKKRTIIFESVKNIFKIKSEVPTDWEGVVIRNKQNAWFLSNEYESEEDENIDLLWNLFELTVNYNEKVKNKEKYEKMFSDLLFKAKGIKNTYKSITFGLFWINPLNLLPLQKNIISFLKKGYNALNDELKDDYLDQIFDNKSEEYIINLILNEQEGYLKFNKKVERIIKYTRFINFLNLSSISYDNNTTKNENIRKRNENDLNKIKKTQNIFEFNKNIIFYGVPGTGKTFNALELVKDHLNNKKDNVLNITFHQSYSYEEFIEGLRAKIKNGSVEYIVEPGIFKDFCKKAEKSNDDYFLIIDEINRGNISKIFGELITLIEDSKREKFKIKLPYSKEDFTVPKNLYIIGTMNTSDRSITSLDVALRRRFNFIEFKPRYDLLKDFHLKDINISELLRTINDRIEILYDKDHIIGHSYFLDIKNATDLSEDEKFFKIKNIFKANIIPLLQDYFYDDFEKIALILGDQFKEQKDQQFFIKKEFDKDIFNSQYEFDDKNIYEINENAFDNPLSYKKIYEK
ncbi:McrB family protein [Mycoplasmopsis cynos]|uniref:5-methylcytosine-specific restriction enzyme B n=3 Tax=Mycoplasmopsis cynos TaxID=171284 RepID=A0A449AIM5_9BACT|nr:AAA family ATPase [Mycoplasmopsis cynos]VEU64865.1 5-methylcytosine-specific restriction enzyme B [Mycoplasmopsis cynos]